MAGRTSYRLFDITLARRTQVSPSLVRFTFTGPQVGQMATHAPDQRIKLFFPKAAYDLDDLFEIAKREEHDWFGAYRALPEAQRPPMRTYTIRALRPARAEVDGGIRPAWRQRARLTLGNGRPPRRPSGDDRPAGQRRGRKARL